MTKPNTTASTDREAFPVKRVCIAPGCRHAVTVCLACLRRSCRHYSRAAGHVDPVAMADAGLRLTHQQMTSGRYISVGVCDCGGRANRADGVARIMDRIREHRG